MLKYLKFLSCILCLIISGSLAQSKMAIGQVNHYLKIKEIRSDTDLTPQQKQQMINEYVQSLSYSEIVSIAEAIRDHYDNKWSEECLMETAAYTGPYFITHKFDYQMAMSEVVNKERPPAWRWLWLDTATSERKGLDPIEPDKVEYYISTLTGIIADKEDDEHVRMRALGKLTLHYYAKLIEIADEVAPTSRKIGGGEPLKEALSGDLRPKMEEKLKPVVEKIEQIVSLTLELLKDPNQGERILIRLLGQMNTWFYYPIVDPDEPKKILKEIFSKRKLYVKEFQRELADILFDDFNDFSILPELEIMLEEADNKFDKYEANKLIKKFKRERLERGLEPAN